MHRILRHLLSKNEDRTQQPQRMIWRPSVPMWFKRVCFIAAIISFFSWFSPGLSVVPLDDGKQTSRSPTFRRTLLNELSTFFWVEHLQPARIQFVFTGTSRSSGRQHPASSWIALTLLREQLDDALSVWNPGMQKCDRPVITIEMTPDAAILRITAPRPDWDQLGESLSRVLCHQNPGSEHLNRLMEQSIAQARQNPEDPVQRYLAKAQGILLDSTMETIPPYFPSETFQWVHPSDFVDVWQDFHNPARTSLIVSADWDERAFNRWLSRFFGPWLKRSTHRNTYPIPEIKTDGPKVCVCPDHASEVRFLVAWLVPRRQDPDFPALHIIRELMTGRLNRVLNATVRFNIQFNGRMESGMFWIHGSCPPEMAPLCFKAIHELLTELSTTPIGMEEFREAQTKARMALANTDTESRMRWVTDTAVYRLGDLPQEREHQRVLSAIPEDILYLGNRFFRLQSTVWVMNHAEAGKRPLLSFTPSFTLDCNSK